MNNCIFTAHCSELTCDKSCPIFTETSYLLERNGLSFTNPVFKSDSSSIEFMNSVLENTSRGIGRCTVTKKAPPAVQRMTTVERADLLTYCAICLNWRGSRLHCNVYHLRYSMYLQNLRDSWGGRAPESLEYMKIWAESSKILIISNLDFVNFGDFESQTLLNLVQNRQASGFTTYFVVPNQGKVIVKDKSPFGSLIRETIVGRSRGNKKFGGE